jgi:hypothetical protein
MDEEKLKLYYIVEHQAKIIKMQAKDIQTLNYGMWSIFYIFIIYAAVNFALSFSTKIRLWRVIK